LCIHVAIKAIDLNRGRTICPHRTGANWCGKFSGQLLAAAQKIRVSGAVIPTARQVDVDVPAVGAEVTRYLIPRCGLDASVAPTAQGTLAKAKSIPNGEAVYHHMLADDGLKKAPIRRRGHFHSRLAFCSITV
jgi:hypothetical protein